MYGQWLWRDGGKMLVITEGELDALSVSQVQSNKWPVVSVNDGAQSAARAVSKALEWIEKFESVIFLFDEDEHGRKAAIECAELLTPGKAKIGRLPLKDASDCLKAGSPRKSSTLYGVPGSTGLTVSYLVRRLPVRA
jgi:twinkle protein